MFGLISKKKLREILVKLNTNVYEELGIDDFYFRCGALSTVNYICDSLKITCPAPEDENMEA